MPKFTLTNMVMIQDESTGNVLVQERVKAYPGIAFPGGHVEKGESIYDSAIREIKEETGFEIKNLTSYGFIYWDFLDGSKYFTYFYKTSDYSGEMLTETAEGKVLWVHPDDLIGMKLSQNMEHYLKMFSGGYTECYGKQISKDEWDIRFR